jgi:hypothetical protein
MMSSASQNQILSLFASIARHQPTRDPAKWILKHVQDDDRDDG